MRTKIQRGGNSARTGKKRNVNLPWRRLRPKETSSEGDCLPEAIAKAMEQYGMTENAKEIRRKIAEELRENEN
eukprot:5203575-Karenia_brevis.AAC.1